MTDKKYIAIVLLENQIYEKSLIVNNIMDLRKAINKLIHNIRFSYRNVTIDGLACDVCKDFYCEMHLLSSAVKLVCTTGIETKEFIIRAFEAK